MAVLTFVPMGIGMIIGPLVMGLLQDNCGHYASITFMGVCFLFFITSMIVLNEQGTFDVPLAYSQSFMLGVIDNCFMAYLNVAICSEFKSTLVPFSTKSFVEQLSVFANLMSFTI